jgi:hypothetical protein
VGVGDLRAGLVRLEGRAQPVREPARDGGADVVARAAVLGLRVAEPRDDPAVSPGAPGEAVE